MTVKELIDRLEQIQDKEIEVCISGIDGFQTIAAVKEQTLYYCNSDYLELENLTGQPELESFDKKKTVLIYADR